MLKKTPYLSTLKLTSYKGLHRRILVVVVPLILISTLSGALGIVLLIRGEIWELYENSALSGLEALAGEISCRGVEKKSVKEVLVKAKHSEFRNFIWVRQGRVLFTVGDKKKSSDLLSHAETLIDNKKSAVTHIGEFGRVKGVLAAVRVDAEHVLVLFEDAGRLQSLKNNGTLIIFLLVIAGFTGVAFTMSYFITAPVLRRLSKLEQSIRLFASGKKDVRLVSDRENMDEFKVVFNSFNEMADTINKLENERRMRAEKEKALFAQLAHDINTPISILRGNAENLREYDSQISSQKKRNLYTDMLAQSIYIQSLVDDLLTMASAKASGLSVHPVKLGLDELLDSVVDTFQPVVEDRGVVIIADGSGLSVWADPVRTRQIFSNLVKNAIVHGGHVSLIEINAIQNGDNVTITVRDDGVGIPVDLEASLFEPYKKGKDGKGSGWGLGLSIVKMLSELQGGDCKYLGSFQGTSFEVVLPYGGG